MSEQNIPIDIAVRKLLDWLVSRRICTRDWHEKAVKIRENIGEAMQDMPENPAMKDLLVGAHINYFHCLKIIEILKDTEVDSKNFFGQYGSKRMIDWKKIISDYESGDVYLSEAAQILIQNVVYELPAVKRHNQKLEQTQADCDKREVNANKRIAELEEEFRKQCRDLGIEGSKLKSEIVSLARDLPSTYSQVASEAVRLKEACSLYQDFIKNNLDEGIELKVLENIKFLVEHGNVTTYQWKYGEKPISVEEPQLDIKDDDEENAADGEIDFGDGGEIDFGGGDDIDFGGDEAEIDFGDSGAEIDFGDGGEIDFDIEGVDTSTIVVEEGGMAGGVARDDEALSLLDNRRTRTLILDELEELSGFLTQRLCETENESLKFSLGSGEQNQDPATLRTMIGMVEGLAGRLTEKKVQQLQMIRDSPAYADRLADTLNQKLKLKQKVISSIDEIRRRRAEAGAEKERGAEQVKVLQRTTAELRKQIESDISERYKGRKVIVSGV